jgi:hypothetical protein
VIKSPFVANQKLTQDVVFKSVQRAKLSFAFDALQKFISGNPEASPQDIHREAGRIVNHVDNIMGLMNRDNLLWNRTARDLASLSMLSVGWNYGTLRSIGSAASELAGGAVRGGKTALNKLAGTNFDAEAPQGSNYRQAKYWLSSAMAAVAYGTIKSYLATGQTPQSTKDVLFPKTGKQDQNGHDVRENPGFYETDLYNWATNPSQTLTDKLSPIMHILGDLGMNKDYQGHEIRNPQDSIGQQIEQVGKYLGTQHLESISVHNIMAKLSRATNPEEMISSVVGGLFNRQAPISVSESPLEKMEQQIEVEKRGAITPEMVDQSKQTGNFVNQFRALTQTDPASGRVTWNGKGGQYQIAHAMAQAGYSQEQIENVAGRALHSGASGIPFDDSLTPADLSRLWTVASPDERQQILPGLQRRISRVKVSAIPKATADAWRALIAQIKQPAIKPQGSE